MWAGAEDELLALAQTQELNKNENTANGIGDAGRSNQGEELM